MSQDILSAPAADSNAIDSADWLELRAFFDQHRESRLDEFDAIARRQSEEQEDNIAEGDALVERRRNEIENEITFRAKALDGEYPFELSDDGERLLFRSTEKERHGRFYLLCLILSHATRSQLLRLPPIDKRLIYARNTLFQVLSTLVLAGETRGQSIWLGWPRESAESILDVVRRSCEACGTGKARQQPAAMANPKAKDGGIDVLSWPTIVDRPPPAYFMFGQSASGHDWSQKSSVEDAQELLQHYFDEHPQCDLRHATVLPFRLSDDELHRSSRRHGTILDRTRAPLLALGGYRNALRGVGIDGYGKSWRILRWIWNYRRWALTA